MKDILVRFVVIFSAFAMLLSLSACSSVVRNSGDELTLNSWHTTLDNGNDISLRFDGDYATLTLNIKDADTYKISGLCECDDSRFIIYDELYGIPYSFSYVVHYDRVDISYNKNTVSLDKIDY